MLSWQVVFAFQLMWSFLVLIQTHWFGYKINTFRNTTCFSWTNIQNELYKKAKYYLTNRTQALDRMVELEGYKTCHPIDSVDATKCAEDCKEMGKQEFGKNCTNNGGLFKCCIRRDKMFCHECRFCCTLPMCTYAPGTRARPIIGIIGIGIGVSVFSRKSVSVCYSFLKIGISKVKSPKNWLELVSV